MIEDDQTCMVKHLTSLYRPLGISWMQNPYASNLELILMVQTKITIGAHLFLEDS